MRNLIFKSIYAVGGPTLLRRKKRDAITVLSLHRISPERDFFFNPIQPETFKKILEYVSRHYSIVQFREIEKNTPKPKLILSFDDGYYDFLETALPIMNQMGIPCNHNVVNDCLNQNRVIWTQQLNDVFTALKNKNTTTHPEIDKVSTFQGNWHQWYLTFFKHLLQTEKVQREIILTKLSADMGTKSIYRMLTWEEFKRCVDTYGVEPGSHSYTHDSLSSIVTEEQYSLEIDQAIRELEDKLNRTIEVFALPNGQYNETVLHRIKACGIKYILLMNDHLYYPSKEKNMVGRIGMLDDPYKEAIMRIELFHSRLR